MENNKVAKLSPEDQKELLAKFKERISDIWPTLSDYQKDDRWLIRWLRLKDMDCVRSEATFRKTLKWRKEEEVDDLLSWSGPTFFQEEYPIQVSGFDKDNAIIGIVPFGKWNVCKAISMGLRTEMKKHVNQIFELALKVQQIRSNKEEFLAHFVVILDFDGFSMKYFTTKGVIDFSIEIIRIFEAHYPETLNNCYILNAPKIFQVLYKILKPLGGPRSLSKVHIYGKDMGQWRAELLKNIESHFLPSPYGGSNTSIFNYKSSYGIDSERMAPAHERFPHCEMQQIHLQPGDQHLVHIDLSNWTSPASDTRLSWNFRTDEHDLGFALLFNPPGTNLDSIETETIFSCANCDAHLHTQTGVKVVDKAGIYTLVLDNSEKYGKTVHYGFATRTGAEILERDAIIFCEKFKYC